MCETSTVPTDVQRRHFRNLRAGGSERKDDGAEDCVCPMPGETWGSCLEGSLTL